MVTAKDLQKITCENRDDEYIKDIIEYIEKSMMNAAKRGYDYLYIEFCGYYLFLVNSLFPSDDTICINKKEYKNFFRDGGGEKIALYFKNKGFTVENTGGMYEYYGLKISW